MILRPPRSTRTDTLFPYTTLFLSRADTLLASIRIGKILDSSLRSIFGLNHLLVLSLGLANAIDTAEQCFPRVDCSLQRHEFFDGVEEFAEVDIMARTFDWFCWQLGRESCRERVCQSV